MHSKWINPTEPVQSQGDMIGFPGSSSERQILHYGSSVLLVAERGRGFFKSGSKLVSNLLYIFNPPAVWKFSPWLSFVTTLFIRFKSGSLPKFRPSSASKSPSPIYIEDALIVFISVAMVLMLIKLVGFTNSL